MPTLAALIADVEELNRMLRNDPQLRANMLLQQLIKPVPFLRDHNEQFETQYMLTEKGIHEMRERIEEMRSFAREQLPTAANDPASEIGDFDPRKHK